MQHKRLDPANPPSPLSTGEPNSFAYKTVTTRKPAVLRQVLADHVYPAPIVEAIENLLDEITQDCPIAPLRTTAPDGPSWHIAWQEIPGATWLNAPWYFVESFLYRRLLAATNYFGDQGAGLREWVGVDPFRPRKQAELAGLPPWRILATALSQADTDRPDSLAALLQFALWGNRADLSYTQVAESASRKLVLEKERQNLLVDDTAAVASHLSTSASQLHFICDNAGAELLIDLALVDYLLRFNYTGQVTLHLKAHPTFVSDTMPTDVDQTLVALRHREEPAFRDLAERLTGFNLIGRLRLQAHRFWNSSRFFWQLPPDLVADLQTAHLVIVKGDANYRRLLGDHRWPTTTPFANIVHYFPAPLVCLRTLKSDPIVGLSPGQAEALDREDVEWRINGQRGVIQASSDYPYRSRKTSAL